MGKKNRNLKKNNFKNKKELPFVSVCTPTFNRRPFFSAIIKCFEWQDYPKDKIEWIIIDDGTDKIEDLVSHIPQVRYFSYKEQMTLGKKRNISNREAKGDIIVYMDDDDYYCPTRVSHAVHMLKLHPKALCAGGSKQLIYFKHIDQMYQLGPYNDNHGTAGTFAFRKELLNITSFQDNAALAEERHFLKNFTVPFVQLDYKQTSVMFSHRHNTYDKKEMLENPNPQTTKPIDIKLSSIIKDEELYNFYFNEIEPLLENYSPGEPTMKPEVLRQQKEMKEMRDKQKPTITAKLPNGEIKTYTMDDMIEIMNSKERQINYLTQELHKKCTEIDDLKKQIKTT